LEKVFVYAKPELDVDGFATLGVVDGRYLGDPRFAPVWAELSRQRATLLVHPSPFSQPVLDLPTPLFEVGFDTARVVVDMLWHRTLEAAPDVRVVLPHGGGCFPALSGRVSMLAGEDWVDNTQQVTAAQIEQAASRFWYDTAMSGSLPSLSALLAVTSPDHVLYGSDFGAPCASEDVLQHNVRLLHQPSSLTSRARRAGTPRRRTLPRRLRPDAAPGHRPGLRRIGQRGDPSPPGTAAGSMGGSGDDLGGQWLKEVGPRLADLTDQRLAEMDAGGVDMQVLSLTTRGVEVIDDPAEAVAAARRVNDYLASVIAAHPTRIAGFAALPLQDPDAAVAELRQPPLLAVRDPHRDTGEAATNGVRRPLWTMTSDATPRAWLRFFPQRFDLVWLLGVDRAPVSTRSTSRLT
jgi:predicted TIM-barrel fold metal-dependent hydrolase